MMWLRCDVLKRGGVFSPSDEKCRKETPMAVQLQLYIKVALMRTINATSGMLLQCCELKAEACE